MGTIVKCLRTVCVARTEQEPSMICSRAFGSCKFALNVRTHREINDGHRFSIFERDLPASLKVHETIQELGELFIVYNSKKNSYLNGKAKKEILQISSRNSSMQHKEQDWFHRIQPRS